MILQYLDDEERLSSDMFSDVFVVKINKTVPTTTNSIIRRLRTGANAKAVGDEFDNRELEFACQPEFEWIAHRDIDAMAFTGKGELFDQVFFVFGEKEDAALFKTFFA